MRFTAATRFLMAAILVGLAIFGAKAHTRDGHTYQHNWKTGGVWHTSGGVYLELADPCSYWGHVSDGIGHCLGASTHGGAEAAHPGYSIEESMIEILDENEDTK